VRSLRVILIYLAFVFLGGALVAPWLWFLVQWLAEATPTLEPLSRQPFSRYVSRCFLVLALAGLWPFLRALGIKSWAGVGLSRAPGRWRWLAIGFAAGFLSLALVAGLNLAVGARQLNLDHTAAVVLGNFLAAALAAVVVAVLEELLFRGALFGTLRRDNPLAVAVLASSGLYALLHFFQRPAPPAEVNWLTGLALLPEMLRGFVDAQQLVPGFFNLTLAGAILAMAFHRTGSLFLSIGLHAGWIFWLKSYGFLTRDVPGATVGFWGTGKLIDGWLALVALAVVSAVVWRATVPAKNSASTP
jgi:membrane protease YdiL (CAAX protease family)